MEETDLPYQLVLFRGFGDARHVCVAGRVVKRSHIVPRLDDAGVWRRLRDGWKLLISRRVARAQIELRCGDHVWRAESDRHGHFFSCHDMGADKGFAVWSHYRARLLGLDLRRPVEATGEVLHAPPSADQLVISDIDDTIVPTGVANKLLMLWRLYVSRISSRAPFPGVGALLRGLHDGRSGHSMNPIIYVSRSPWSIYPMLDELFNKHDIPIGPVLLLRDWGISWRHPFPRRAQFHKDHMIDLVLKGFPDLPVILIGDSGQHDPEVYAAVVRRHAGRVKGIYIRELSAGRKGAHDLAALALRLQGQGAHLFASTSSEEMAADAIDRGWMVARGQAAVRRDAETDEL